MVALLQCTLLQPLEGGTVPALQAVLGGAPDDVHHGAVLGAVARHQVSCRHQRHRATRGLARRPATIICRVDYTCNINMLQNISPLKADTYFETG